MKSGDKQRLAAVRLILAKLKDKDIELRTAVQVPDDDLVVTDVLQKMAKQRRESITLYEQGGRDELAAVEKAELAVTAPRAWQLRSPLLKFCNDTFFNAAHVVKSGAIYMWKISSPRFYG